MCAQWKAKNVSNSREIEKLIQSLEEDISFGKEVKRSWGAGKGFDKNFPSWPNPFFPSSSVVYIIIQQFGITIDSVHRSHWWRAKKSETKLRSGRFSETDEKSLQLFLFSPGFETSLFTELYYSWRCCVETSWTSLSRPGWESRSHLIDKSFPHFLPNILTDSISYSSCWSISYSHRAVHGEKKMSWFVVQKCKKLNKNIYSSFSFFCESNSKVLLESRSYLGVLAAPVFFKEDSKSGI